MFAAPQIVKLSHQQQQQQPSSKLRGYVVLTAKAPRRARLTSACSFRSTTSSSSSTASEDEDEEDQYDELDDLEDPAALDCSMAYESYAAVTSRYNNSNNNSRNGGGSGGSPRELRWSDLNRSSGPRGPRIELTKFLSTKSSQNARKRQLKKNAGLAGSGGTACKNQENELLEMHTLELCLEFLDVSDLVNGTLVCAEFRHVITESKRLLLALYSHKWRPFTATPLGGAYLNASFQSQLTMCRERNQSAQLKLAYPLATRSSVKQNAVNGTYEIQNNSMLRSFARGSVDSVRGTQGLPVLPCAKALQKQLSYFEVSMKGCGSVGVVSLSDETSRNAYGFGSEEHLGWKSVSYGYHGNDGDFVYNDGSAAYGGEWTPLGPSWGAVGAQSDADAATFTVGCGLDRATGALFFTLNGTLVGIAPVAILKGKYAAAVSLHSYGDAATLNVGSVPFRFDIEGFCASP
ncbi:Spry domain-containing protein [Globisporangium polare]